MSQKTQQWQQVSTNPPVLHLRRVIPSAPWKEIEAVLYVGEEAALLTMRAGDSRRSTWMHSDHTRSANQPLATSEFAAFLKACADEQRREADELAGLAAELEEGLK
jgi:hypothetical protein